MKLLVNAVKTTLLAGALAILAVSALPSSAVAQGGGENCASSGHTCHFVADGKVIHAKEQTEPE